MQPTFESRPPMPGPAGAAPPPTLLAAVLSPGECAALLVRADAVGFTPTGRLYPPRYRNNDRGVLDDEALAEWLFARVHARLPSSIAGPRGPLSLRRLNPRFRLCRYRDGQAFAVHQDGAYAPAPDERSRLTLQISLSAPEAFSGGATRFYAARGGALTHAFRPGRGSALLFPHDVWHDGEPVTTGTKIVLRTDVVYDDAIDDGASTEGDTAGVLKGHRGYVFDALPLPSGFIVTGARDKTVRRFHATRTARPAAARYTCDRAVTAHASSVTCLALAGDRIVAGSRDGVIMSFDHALDDARVERREGAAVLSLASGTDGGWLAATADGFVVDAHGTARRLHDGWVWKVLSLADGTRLTAGEDGTVVRSRPDGQVLVRRPLGGAGVRALATLADGRVVAGLADGSVHWLEMTATADGLAPLRSLAAHGQAVTSLAPLDLDGDGAFEALASAGEDGAVHVWEGDGALRASWRRPCFIRAVRTLADGAGLLVAGDDGRVVIVDPRGA